MKLSEVYNYMAPILGYWDLRGLGESSRLLLRYAEVEWEDVVFPLDRVKWSKCKPQLGLELPNLPYLIDGDIKITQSIAIIRYLGRKYQLAPSNEAEQIRCDMAEQEIMDATTRQGMLCYNPNMESLKAGYLDTLTDKLELLDSFLGKGPWLLGEKMTYVDFLYYELLDHIRTFSSDHFNSTKNINNFSKRFEALPFMRKWFDSDKYKEGSYIYMPVATWHGKE